MRTMLERGVWYCICGREFQVSELKLPTRCDCPCHGAKEPPKLIS